VWALVHHGWVGLLAHASRPLVTPSPYDVRFSHAVCALPGLDPWPPQCSWERASCRHVARCSLGQRCEHDSHHFPPLHVPSRSWPLCPGLLCLSTSLPSFPRGCSLRVSSGAPCEGPCQCCAVHPVVHPWAGGRSDAGGSMRLCVALALGWVVFPSFHVHINAGCLYVGWGRVDTRSGRGGYPLLRYLAYHHLRASSHTFPPPPLLTAHTP
jgi:hypothetical protein